MNSQTKQERFLSARASVAYFAELLRKAEKELRESRRENEGRSKKKVKLVLITPEMTALKFKLDYWNDEASRMMSAIVAGL